jgi:AcrR family transcriptional regulator
MLYNKNERSFLYGGFVIDSNTLSKGERTRQAIIDAAHQLFVDQGYAATSMRQIADRCGLALGGIYNHFPNKEAIFAEVLVVRHPFNQVLPLLQAATGDTFEDFVRNAAKSMVAELGKRPDFIKLMFVELVEFEGRNMPRILETVFPQVLPLVERFSVGNGELRDIDPFVLFRAFLGLFFSYYMTEFLLAGTPVAAFQRNPLDSFVEIFLHGVIAPKE